MEAILIHLSKDSQLNSKNEYNANCLTRVTVEETKFERKSEKRRFGKSLEGKSVPK